MTLELSKLKANSQSFQIDGSYLLPELHYIYNNVTRFLYYFSVYVSLSKNSFFFAPQEPLFSKAGAKVRTIFQTTKCFDEKVYIFNSILDLGRYQEVEKAK